MIALTKFDILIKKSIQRALADGEPLAQLVSGVCLGLGCERWGSPFMLPGVAFVCAYMRPRGICADVHTLIAKRGGSCRECCGNSLAACSGHVKVRFLKLRGQGTSAREAEKGFPSHRPFASGSALTPRAPRAASARSRHRAARSGS